MIWYNKYEEEYTGGLIYVINILDFNITEKQNYHTEIIAADKDTGKQFTDLMSIHFFELRKVNDILDVNDKKSLWMHLIKADTEEELNMIKNTNIPAMEQAVQVIFDMSADTALRERARMREKAILDEISNLEGAREEGRCEGRAEGRAEERNFLISKLKAKGMTDEQINALLN